MEAKYVVVSLQGLTLMLPMRLLQAQEEDYLG
jgi:hypothetical protein